MARNNSNTIFKVGGIAGRRRQIKAALVSIRANVGSRVLDERFADFVEKIGEAEESFDAAMGDSDTA